MAHHRQCGSGGGGLVTARLGLNDVDQRRRRGGGVRLHVAQHVQHPRAVSAFRFAKPVGDLAQRQRTKPAQRGERIVPDKMLPVTERLDQVGDGRRRRLAKHRQAGRTAGANFRALVKIHPAQEILPVDARHFVDGAQQGLFPNRIGVAQRDPQPRDGVGAQLRHGALRGDAAFGVGGDEQVLHPLLEWPAVHHRPTVALGHDEEQDEHDQCHQANLEPLPFPHGKSLRAPTRGGKKNQSFWA